MWFILPLVVASPEKCHLALLTHMIKVSHVVQNKFGWWESTPKVPQSSVLPWGSSETMKWWNHESERWKRWSPMRNHHFQFLATEFWGRRRQSLSLHHSPQLTSQFDHMMACKKWMYGQNSFLVEQSHFTRSGGLSSWQQRNPVPECPKQSVLRNDLKMPWTQFRHS